MRYESFCNTNFANPRLADHEVQARTDSNSLPVALPGTSTGVRDDFNCGFT